MNDFMMSMFNNEGFGKIDKENNCITVNGYGAYITSINNRKNLSSFKKLTSKGYILCIGPSYYKNFKYGVFCKNYEEICNREKKNYDLILYAIEELLKSSLSLNEKKMQVKRIIDIAQITDDVKLDTMIKSALNKMNYRNNTMFYTTLETEFGNSFRRSIQEDYKKTTGYELPVNCIDVLNKIDKILMGSANINSKKEYVYNIIKSKVITGDKYFDRMLIRNLLKLDFNGKSIDLYRNIRKEFGYSFRDNIAKQYIKKNF